MLSALNTVNQVKRQRVTWEVALPTGRSEGLSDGVVFAQRLGRVGKTQLAEMGDVHPRQRVHQVQVPEAQNNNWGGWSRGSERWGTNSRGSWRSRQTLDHAGPWTGLNFTLKPAGGRGTHADIF